MALVARWLLAEIDGSGHTPDATGNGWTGTVKPTYPSNCPAVGAGPFPSLPNGIVFDGTDDYVDVGLVHTVTDVFSLSAWIRPNSLGRFSIYSAGNTTVRPTFSVGAANGALEITSPGVYQDVSVAGVVVAGRWQHVVYSRAGKLPQSGRAFFVNAVRVAMSSQTDNDLAANTVPTTIGCRAAGVQQWPGGLADVRLYNHALTAAEVYDIYQESLRENAALLGLVP